jgi:hypothetical protein
LPAKLFGSQYDCILYSVLWYFVLGKHWNTRDSSTVMMQSTICGLVWHVGVIVVTVLLLLMCETQTST